MMLWYFRAAMSVRIVIYGMEAGDRALSVVEERMEVSKNIMGVER